MSLNSRTTSLGFAERTKKNLLFVEQAFVSGDDVHVITQVVNSLLGLVIFPWERGFLDRIRNLLLTDLEKMGWPSWHLLEGKCVTLGQLTRYLRNGTSHGHIQFSSDSRFLEEVNIQVSNFPKWSAPRPDFIAEIRADHLREFCLNFASLVHNTIG